jgi:hypothetical protein
MRVTYISHFLDEFSNIRDKRFPLPDRNKNFPKS